MSKEASINKITSAIFDIVEKDPYPIPRYVLFKKLISNKSLGYIQNDDFDNAIKQLVDEKKIFILKSQKIVLFKNKKEIDFTKENKMLLKGVISINSSGNGFINLVGEEKAKYYVAKENINNAQNSDLVEFYPLEKNVDEGKLINSVVNVVIEHGKNLFVGEYIYENNQYHVKLDDLKITLEIKLNNTTNLVNGQKILIEITKYEGNIGYGDVKMILGHKSDVGVDILSIVIDNGVEPDFPIPVLDYANKLTLDVQAERKVRTDLTNKPIVTIDPATSKDFDDAFYCEKTIDGNYLLSVQIADVSHYVKQGSILDKEAMKRGCSIYLVDRVIPMLPHNLSDDLCSINPNVERLAQCCEMVIDKKGNIIKINLFPAIIKSWRRFNYDEVNSFIEDKNYFNNEKKEIIESLNNALELTKILSNEKAERGYIDFAIPQATIKVDEKCVPTEIIVKKQGKAQKMIEDFMVAANEAVTMYADQHNLPFIYRVHDKPSIQGLKMFEVEAKKMDFKITDVENIDSTTISKWLKQNENNKDIELARMMLLRCMAKAKYSVNNIGHFGLASNNYTHFTSPIRRYPDLIVHRIFWECIFNKNTSDAMKNELKNNLNEIAETSSENELIAMKCERDVEKMKFAEYMQKHIGEEFNGIISSIQNFGIYVLLDNLVEGIISTRNISREDFQINKASNSVNFKGRKYDIGNKVKIKVISSDKNTRIIEFELLK